MCWLATSSSCWNGTATSFSPIPRKPPTPTTTTVTWPLRSTMMSFTSPIDSLLGPTTVVPMTFDAIIWFGWICVRKWPCMLPALEADVCGIDVPAPEAVPTLDGVDPTAPVPALGCIADEPVFVDPEPVAVGRSVAADGGGAWAKAGAAARAVATRQAAMCVFSMSFLLKDAFSNRKSPRGAHDDNVRLTPSFRPSLTDPRHALRSGLRRHAKAKTPLALGRFLCPGRPSGWLVSGARCLRRLTRPSQPGETQAGNAACVRPRESAYGSLAAHRLPSPRLNGWRIAAFLLGLRLLLHDRNCRRSLLLPEGDDREIDVLRDRRGICKGIGAVENLAVSVLEHHRRLAEPDDFDRRNRRGSDAARR